MRLLEPRHLEEDYLIATVFKTEDSNCCFFFFANGPTTFMNLRVVS